jgi:hypothetical protein
MQTDEVNNYEKPNENSNGLLMQWHCVAGRAEACLAFVRDWFVHSITIQVVMAWVHRNRDNCQQTKFQVEGQKSMETTDGISHFTPTKGILKRTNGIPCARNV